MNIVKFLSRIGRRPSVWPAVMAVSVFFMGLSCSRTGWRRAEGMVWNTTWHLTYRGPESLSDSVLRVLDEVGRSLNVFDSLSVVSRVNRNCSVRIDGDFRRVYVSSLVVNAVSGGLFDPTVGPVVKAWGFGPGHTLSADTAAVDSLLRFTGIRKTRLVGDTLLVKEDVRTQFNFSAIAKGYACDRIGEMLRRNGASDYLIEIGGELAAGGESPRGGKWLVSVDNPVLTDTTEVHDALGVIAVSGCGVATSGNYRNFKRIGGKVIGHTVSPLTGRPVQADVISASVVAPTSMEADAAATACMAAGSRGGRAIIAELGFEAMLVMADSTIWTSAGWPWK